MITFATGVGLLAATLTALANLPQIIKVWRTRQSDDLSWGMLTLLGCGLCTWISYGILRADWVVVGSNSVGLVLVLCLAVLKGTGDRTRQ